MSEQLAQVESPTPLHDYLYVDKERIAAYHTQLLGMGVPLQSKYTQNASASEGSTGQAGMKFLGGGITSNDTSSHGSERSFDLSWPMVLQTIDELTSRGHIHDAVLDVPVGSIVRVTGIMQLVDLRLMRELWAPMSKMFDAPDVSVAGAMTPSLIADVAKLIPHPLVMQLITSDKPIGEPFSVGPESITTWGVLATENVIGTAETFSLMNGGMVPGIFNMIALLDVGSSQAPPPNYFEGEPPTNTFNLMMSMQHMITQTFGRPYYANGVTPLVVYRNLRRRESA